MSFWSRFNLLSLLAITVPTATALASENSTLDITQQVYDLVDVEKFDDALALLSVQPVEEQWSFEHRFLRARVLMWKGDYSGAEAVFNSLDNDFPDNADIELSRANLDFYRGELDEAEARFVRVLEMAPDYAEAKAGLQKVTEAKSEPSFLLPTPPTLRPWRIDVASGTTAVEGGPDWREHSLRLERGNNDLLVHGKAERFERFGLIDTQLEAGIAKVDPEQLLWSATVAATPDDDFRPEYSLGGSVGKVVKFDETAVQFGVGYRHDAYAQTKLHVVSPEASVYLSNGAVIVARAISVSEQNEDHQLGWFAMGSLPVSEKVSLRVGGAIAPEAVNGVVNETQSYFSGLDYDLTSGLQLTANYSHDARDVGFDRDTFRVGITRKF